MVNVDFEGGFFKITGQDIISEDGKSVLLSFDQFFQMVSLMSKAVAKPQKKRDEAVACNWSYIQFRPDRRTGEFVNIGIVLHCPQTGYCEHNIFQNSEKRIKRFFPTLENQVINNALKFAYDLADDFHKQPDPSFLLKHIKRYDGSVGFGEGITTMTTEPYKFLNSIKEMD